MHNLCTNSLNNLKHRLTSQNALSPSHEEISTWVDYYQSQTGSNTDITMEQDSDDEDENNIDVVNIEAPSSTNSESVVNKLYDPADTEDQNRPTPLFETKITVDPHTVSCLVFSPSEETFVSSISKIMQKFEDTCKTVHPLVSDVQFESFTKPLINRKFEQKTCGEGPQLDVVIENDSQISELKSEIETAIVDSFDLCDCFANYLLVFYNYFKQNEECDISVFETEDSVALFKEALSTYARQDAQIKTIHDQRKIGMLLLKNQHFKETIGPSPVKMLTILRELLPQKFSKKLSKLVEEIQDMMFRLEQQPSSTGCSFNLSG